MATRTISAVGGNWNTTAAWVEAVVPTAADDVVANALSATIAVTAASVCRSMDLTGFTATINGSGDLSIGDGSGGACKLAGTVSGTWTVSFISTSNNGGAGWNITSGGKTFPGAVTFNGAGGKWVLQDAFTCGTNALTVTAGGFFGNGQSITCGNLSCSGSTTRTVDLTSCTVSCTQWSSGTITNLTFVSTSSTITMTTTSNTFNGGGLTFATVALTKGGSGIANLTGANTFTTLTFTGSANKADVWTINATQTVTGTLKFVSNSAVNRLLFSSNTDGTQRTFACTGATVNVDNTAAAAGSSVDFKDITITGSPTFTPLNSTLVGDCGGNGGAITTNATAAVATTYNGSASDNWSTVARWSGGRVPLPQDPCTVVAITAGTLTVDMPRMGASIDFTGTTRTVDFSSTTEFYGNLTLATGMTISGTGTVTFAGRGAQTITNNGRTITFSIALGGPGGTYTLQDAFLSNRSSNIALDIPGGTFIDGGQTLTFSGASAGVRLNNALGAVTMTGSWLFGTTGAVTFWIVTAGMVTATGSTITLTATSANTRTFAGGGKTYGTLTYTVAGSTGQLTITGSNTFNTLNFSDVTNARTLALTINTTTTVTTFNVNGTSGKLMSIVSTTAGTPATILKLGNLISVDFVSVKDSTISTSGAFPAYAGANSTNVSGNTGWVFTVPPPLFIYQVKPRIVPAYLIPYRRISRTDVMHSHGGPPNKQPITPRRRHFPTRRGHATFVPTSAVTPTPPTTPCSLLLSNGSSYLLLSDGSSHISLAVCVPAFTPIYPRRRQPPPHRVRRASTTFIPPQVNPPYPLHETSQFRTVRGLLLRRGRHVTPTPAQVNPPYPHTVVSPNRPVPGFLRRGRRTFFIPSQAGATNPAVVFSPSQRRTARNFLRRGRVIVVVPAQANPPYPLREIAQRRSVRGWLFRRGKPVSPVPAQVAAPNPAFVSLVSRRPTMLLRGILARRGKVTKQFITQAVNPSTAPAIVIQTLLPGCEVAMKLDAGCQVSMTLYTGTDVTMTLSSLNYEP